MPLLFERNKANLDFELFRDNLLARDQSTRYFKVDDGFYLPTVLRGTINWHHL